MAMVYVGRQYVEVSGLEENVVLTLNDLIEAKKKTLNKFKKNFSALNTITSDEFNKIKKLYNAANANIKATLAGLLDTTPTTHVDATLLGALINKGERAHTQDKLLENELEAASQFSSAPDEFKKTYAESSDSDDVVRAVNLKIYQEAVKQLQKQDNTLLTIHLGIQKRVEYQEAVTRFEKKKNAAYLKPFSETLTLPKIERMEAAGSIFKHREALEAFQVKAKESLASMDKESKKYEDLLAEYAPIVTDRANDSSWSPQLRAVKEQYDKYQTKIGELKHFVEEADEKLKGYQQNYSSPEEIKKKIQTALTTYIATAEEVTNLAKIIAAAKDVRTLESLFNTGTSYQFFRALDPKTESKVPIDSEVLKAASKRYLELRLKSVAGVDLTSFSLLTDRDSIQSLFNPPFIDTDIRDALELLDDDEVNKVIQEVLKAQAVNIVVDKIKELSDEDLEKFAILNTKSIKNDFGEGIKYHVNGQQEIILESNVVKALVPVGVGQPDLIQDAAKSEAQTRLIKQLSSIPEEDVIYVAASKMLREELIAKFQTHSKKKGILSSKLVRILPEDILALKTQAQKLALAHLQTEMGTMENAHKDNNTALAALAAPPASGTLESIVVQRTRMTSHNEAVADVNNKLQEGITAYKDLKTKYADVGGSAELLDASIKKLEDKMAGNTKQKEEYSEELKAANLALPTPENAQTEINSRLKTYLASNVVNNGETLLGIIEGKLESLPPPPPASPGTAASGIAYLTMAKLIGAFDVSSKPKITDEQKKSAAKKYLEQRIKAKAPADLSSISLLKNKPAVQEFFNNIYPPASSPGTDENIEKALFPLLDSEVNEVIQGVLGGQALDLLKIGLTKISEQHLKVFASEKPTDMANIANGFTNGVKALDPANEIAIGSNLLKILAAKSKESGSDITAEVHAAAQAEVERRVIEQLDKLSEGDLIYLASKSLAEIKKQFNDGINSKSTIPPSSEKAVSAELIALLPDLPNVLKTAVQEKALEIAKKHAEKALSDVSTTEGKLALAKKLGGAVLKALAGNDSVNQFDLTALGISNDLKAALPTDAKLGLTNEVNVLVQVQAQETAIDMLKNAASDKATYATLKAITLFTGMKGSLLAISSIKPPVLKSEIVDALPDKIPQLKTAAQEKALEEIIKIINKATTYKDLRDSAPGTEYQGLKNLSEEASIAEFINPKTKNRHSRLNIPSDLIHSVKDLDRGDKRIQAAAKVRLHTLENKGALPNETYASINLALKSNTLHASTTYAPTVPAPPPEFSPEQLKLMLDEKCTAQEVRVAFPNNESLITAIKDLPENEDLQLFNPTAKDKANDYIKKNLLTKVQAVKVESMFSTTPATILPAPSATPTSPNPTTAPTVEESKAIKQQLIAIATCNGLPTPKRLEVAKAAFKRDIGLGEHLAKIPENYDDLIFSETQVSAAKEEIVKLIQEDVTAKIKKGLELSMTAYGNPSISSPTEPPKAEEGRLNEEQLNALLPQDSKPEDALTQDALKALGINPEMIAVMPEGSLTAASPATAGSSSSPGSLDSSPPRAPSSTVVAQVKIDEPLKTQLKAELALMQYANARKSENREKLEEEFNKLSAPKPLVDIFEYQKAKFKHESHTPEQLNEAKAAAAAAPDTPELHAIQDLILLKTLDEAIKAPATVVSVTGTLTPPDPQEMIQAISRDIEYTLLAENPDMDKLKNAQKQLAQVKKMCDLNVLPLSKENTHLQQQVEGLESKISAITTPTLDNRHTIKEIKAFILKDMETFLTNYEKSNSSNLDEKIIEQYLNHLKSTKKLGGDSYRQLAIEWLEDSTTTDNKQRLFDEIKEASFNASPPGDQKEKPKDSRLDDELANSLLKTVQAYKYAPEEGPHRTMIAEQLKNIQKEADELKQYLDSNPLLAGKDANERYRWMQDCLNQCNGILNNEGAKFIPHPYTEMQNQSEKLTEYTFDNMDKYKKGIKDGEGKYLFPGDTNRVERIVELGVSGQESTSSTAIDKFKGEKLIVRHFNYPIISSSTPNTPPSHNPLNHTVLTTPGAKSAQLISYGEGLPPDVSSDPLLKQRVVDMATEWVQMNGMPTEKNPFHISGKNTKLKCFMVLAMTELCSEMADFKAKDSNKCFKVFKDLDTAEALALGASKSSFYSGLNTPSEMEKAFNVAGPKITPARSQLLADTIGDRKLTGKSAPSAEEKGHLISIEEQRSHKENIDKIVHDYSKGTKTNDTPSFISKLRGKT